MTSLWHDTSDPARIPVHELVPGASFDAVVAGAGLTGLTTAVLLARAGVRTAVLEAREVGALTTGHTTAKSSLLQGTTLSRIRGRHSADVLRSYVAANRAGQEWLLEVLAGAGVDVQRRPAFTYATTSDGAADLRRELAAAQEAGLEVTWQDTTELPFPVAGALRLDDQAQFHPLEALAALAREFDALGGTLVEHVRVTGAGRRGPLDVETTRGPVRADRLVLATGVPVLDRGGHSVRIQPQRSSILAFRLKDGAQSPRGMHLSAESPVHSLRSVTVGDETRLLVGGAGHVTGRSLSSAADLAELESWARQHFDLTERTHAWSAQDYVAAGALPLVGDLPASDGTILAATGFAKWGITNAVAAALALVGRALGDEPAWSPVLYGAGASPGTAATGASYSAEVGGRVVRDWVAAELHPLPQQSPAEGQGVVGRHDRLPVAVSTVDGQTCRVSGVCPHLGGILHWNDAERSWDCPLHGSRFAPDGTRLEGPAVRDLSPVDSTVEGD